ncbi:hypothetical protein KDA_36300 [Dictyobacter alpinus]|uniref:Uncharacterized protein n=2 Tax=Dictyobacter alpinus TaxID=2014873 RepID=A0A402B9Z4_9CHLR|nr:hypothetical protein KDA_36300 [Dictyobacter alpinus]
MAGSGNKRCRQARPLTQAVILSRQRATGYCSVPMQYQVALGPFRPTARVKGGIAPLPGYEHADVGASRTAGTLIGWPVPGGWLVRGGGVGAPPNDVQASGPSLDPYKHISHK